MKVKLLDAFAGIGGFHLGVKQACEELGHEFEYFKIENLNLGGNYE